MKFGIGIGNISSKKIRGCISSEYKEIATKTNVKRQFKDFFRENLFKTPTKQSRLDSLWEQLHSGPRIENQHNNSMSVHNIECAIAFIKMRALAEKEMQSKFKILIKKNPFGTTYGFSFKIGNRTILTNTVTEATNHAVEETVITKFTQQQNDGLVIEDITPDLIITEYQKQKELFDSISQVNKQIRPYNRLTLEELNSILENCKSTELKDKHKSKLFSKRETGLKHSYLLIKDDDQSSILVKPNLKNEDEKHKHFRSGTTKYIKTSGYMISLNNKKEFISVDRVITHSKAKVEEQDRKDEKTEEAIENVEKTEKIEEKKSDNLKVVKDAELSKNCHADLVNDGFLHVTYTDGNGVNREIYIKKYLGEALHVVKISLSDEDKKNIAKQLMQKFEDENPGDIKPVNTTWDGENAHFIDSKKMVFTYTTKYGKDVAIYDENTEKEEVKKQQILGLTVVFYELFNPNLRVPKALHHNAEKTADVKIAKGMFSEYVRLAYNSELTLEKLQEAVDKL